ncbi:trypsin domain-containing protein [Ditylenchus destructor]|nr:trypsin domain-containing protein [Ditylenchus destructor]
MRKRLTHFQFLNIVFIKPYRNFAIKLAKRICCCYKARRNRDIVPLAALQPMFDKDFQVVVGQLNITTEKTKRLDIAAHVQHPEYILEHDDGGGLKKIDNDIAIIKLATPLEYSKTIQPICLPSSFEEDTSTTKENAVIAGWGDKDDYVLSDVLLEGTNYFVDLKECQKQTCPFLCTRKCTFAAMVRAL